jgi:hypothetical protein
VTFAPPDESLAGFRKTAGRYEQRFESSVLTQTSPLLHLPKQLLKHHNGRNGFFELLQQDLIFE